MRILLFKGYVLPEAKKIGEFPCKMKLYGAKAFDKMMKAGKDSRDKGIARFTNLLLADQTPPPPPQETTSTSSHPPPSPRLPLQRPQLPLPPMDQMTAMIAGLQTHLDAKIEGMFLGLETHLDAKLDGISMRVMQLETFAKDTKKEVEHSRIATSQHLSEIDATQKEMKATQLELQKTLSEMDSGLEYVWTGYFSQHMGEYKVTYDSICGRTEIQEESDEDDSSSDDDDDDDNVVSIVSDDDQAKTNATQEDEEEKTRKEENANAENTSQKDATQEDDKTKED